jgi:CheY-like chemotaxis protein
MNLASVVLLVDSDRDNREMYGEFLSSKGYVAITAATAEEALPLAVDADVVITDTRLRGGLDGFDFISALRNGERTKDLPIITLTGSALDGEREQAFGAGADLFLRKPCIPAELLSRVRRVMRLVRVRPAV